MPLFDITFYEKNNHRQNQEPGVFGEKAEDLPRSFEKEADYRTDKTG